MYSLLLAVTDTWSYIADFSGNAADDLTWDILTFGRTKGSESAGKCCFTDELMAASYDQNSVDLTTFEAAISPVWIAQVRNICFHACCEWLSIGLNLLIYLERAWLVLLDLRKVSRLSTYGYALR